MKNVRLTSVGILVLAPAHELTQYVHSLISLHFDFLMCKMKIIEQTIYECGKY